MFKSINIKKVTIEGFSGFKEKAIFEFYDKTRISGGNGQGKSSIGEAIVWTFLGSNLWGNDKADSDLLNNESKGMEVEVKFGDGKTDHTLTRTRKGRTTTIILDSSQINQTDLTALIGSKQIFLSIFNLEYFQHLGNSGRDFLVSILDKIEPSDVLKSIDDYTIDYIKDDLNMIHANPNEYMKGKRAEIKEFEKDLIFNEGVISKLNINVENKELKAFDDSELLKLEKELDKLQYVKTEPDTEEYEKLVEKKNRLEKEIVAINAREFKKEDITKDYKTLMEYEKKIVEVKSEKFEANREKEKQKLTLESELSYLRNDYAKTNTLSLKEGDDCPTCKTKISNQHLTVLVDSIKDDLSNLANAGKEKAQQLDELVKGLKHEEETFNLLKEKKLNKLKENHSKLANKLKAIETNNLEGEKEFNLKKSQNIKLYKEKVQDIVNKMNSIKETYLQEEKTKINALEIERGKLREKITLLRNDKNSIDAYNMEIKLIEDQSRKDKVEYNRLIAENERLNKSITDCNSKIVACKEYTTAKVQELSGIIHSHLDDVTISLQKIVKSTGELKDCFEIMYKGRDFKVISRSEKMKAALEISNLVMNVTKRKYPVFIDNKESITNYTAPNTQIIEAKVIDTPVVYTVNLDKNIESEKKVADKTLDKEIMINTIEYEQFSKMI